MAHADQLAQILEDRLRQVQLAPDLPGRQAKLTLDLRQALLDRRAEVLGLRLEQPAEADLEPLHLAHREAVHQEDGRVAVVELAGHVSA